MSEAQLQWLEVRDFTKGIRQRGQTDPAYTNNGQTSALNGLAVEAQGIASHDGTFRCIALPDGGLGPLPRSSSIPRTGSPLPANTTAVTTGFGIMGPTSIIGGTPVDYGRPEDQSITTRNNSFIVGYHYDSGANRIVKVERWRFSPSGTPTFDSLYSFTDTNDANQPPVPVWIAFGRSAYDAFGPLQAGPPVVMVSYAGYEAIGFTFVFPDPHAAGIRTLTPYSPSPSTIGQGMAVAHQSRFAIFTPTVWAQGANNLYSSTNEDVFFTAPNDVYGTISSAISNFSPEDPVGVGVAASLSASDLLLIKHQYGAYLVQGALETPMVRRMPGVMPTMGAQQKGALTGIGFVYGANGGGVYSWGGGDSSQNISPQLDNGFWQVNGLPGESVSTNGLKKFNGSFSAFGEWVMAPNNWLYDPASNSWWRLEDPSVIQFWMYQPDILLPSLYACGTTWTNSNNAFIYQFDRTLGATSWQWTSQPIILGNYRMVDFKDMMLGFHSQSSSGGTITVTMYDEQGGSTSRAISYAHNAGRLQMIRFTLNPTPRTMALMRFRIVADGGSNTAPIVSTIRFGYEEIKEIARS